MIENIKACKGRKSLENIELRNAQSQNLKYLSSDHRLFWVENNGNWEKMNAAQNIDCPIVDIIQGSTKAVEFQWDNNHGKYIQDSLMLHSKEVIENQFQPSIGNGYDGTRQIADTTTSPKSSMKRQNQEYGQQLSQMITRRELSDTIKPYSRADFTPETEVNQRKPETQSPTAKVNVKIRKVTAWFDDDVVRNGQ